MVAFVQTAVVLNTIRNGFGRIGTDLGDGQAMVIAKVSTNSDQINVDCTIRIWSEY
jgi:hypothetical protein